jgi:hypothetical protein
MAPMRVGLRPLLPLLAAPLLLAPAPAVAAKPVKNLWATVNRCDTPTAPNTLGVRASMPGMKGRTRLYMHFRVQFWSATRQTFVDSEASTRWLRVGEGAGTTQSGFNFTFADPPPGEQFVLRGVVKFRYSALRKQRNGKKRWKVVKRYERATRSGQQGVQAAEPEGASFSMCIVRRETGEGRS